MHLLTLHAPCLIYILSCSYGSGRRSVGAVGFVWRGAGDNATRFCAAYFMYIYTIAHSSRFPVSEETAQSRRSPDFQTPARVTLGARHFLGPARSS